MTLLKITVILFFLFMLTCLAFQVEIIYINYPNYDDILLEHISLVYIFIWIIVSIVWFIGSYRRWWRGE